MNHHQWTNLGYSQKRTYNAYSPNQRSKSLLHNLERKVLWSTAYVKSRKSMEYWRLTKEIQRSANKINTFAFYNTAETSFGSLSRLRHLADGHTIIQDKQKNAERGEVNFKKLPDRIIYLGTYLLQYDCSYCQFSYPESILLLKMANIRYLFDSSLFNTRQLRPYSVFLTLVCWSSWYSWRPICSSRIWYPSCTMLTYN